MFEDETMRALGNADVFNGQTQAKFAPDQGLLDMPGAPT